MKTNSYSILTFTTLWIMYLLMAACTKEQLLHSPDEMDKETTIRIIIPTATTTVTRTTGDDETRIDNMYVAEYSDKGQCTALRPVDIGKQLVSGEDRSYRLTLKSLNLNTSEVHLLANAGNVLAPYMANASKLPKPDQLFSTEGRTAPFKMWGQISRQELQANANVTLSLIRNVAKATISMDATLNGDRTIQSWKIINTANKGSLANTTSPAVPNIAGEDGLDTTVGSTEADGATDEQQTLYFFETPTAKKDDTNIDTRIVLKSADKYYTACFLNANGERLALLRNHHYQITVKHMDAGYATEKEALEASPGNVQLEIKDYNCLITNLISNGTYELGTCDTVRIVSEAGSDNRSAYFVIMCGKDIVLPSEEEISVEGNVDWIKGLETIQTEDINSGSYSSVGRKHTLSFSFDKNPTEKVRQGEIKIKFRTISSSICIKQAGSNLKEDRPITIYGLKGDAPNGRDYIEFLTQTVKGASADDMGGRGMRNNGLQLGIGPHNNYTYKIQKLPGDLLKKTASWITVTEDEGFFIIKSKVPDDSKVWVTSLVIVTKDDITISYDLYHNGIFWQLPEGLDETAEPQASRWRYYEMVESSIENVWMLDRNIGAASVNDAGYLCKLIDGDKDQPIAELCPSGFVLPSASLWKNLLPELKTVTRYKVDGSSFQSVELESQDGKGIRFPFGGFNNGFTIENEGIGYYWSKSPVAGNQGFDANSPEYGYWYNTARISTGGSGLMSLRYVGGSNGISDGRYKYLSTRCVLDNGSATEKNRLTIYDRRPNKSKALYVYIATENNEYRNRKCGELIRPADGDGEATLYYDMIDPDIIKQSIGKPLYIHFREGQDLTNEGWIGEKMLIGEEREFEVTNISTQ